MKLDENKKAGSVEFPLRRPVFWNSTMLAILAGALAGGVLSFLRLQAKLGHLATAAQLGRPFAIGGGIVVVAIAVRAITRPKEVPPLRLEQEALFLPRSAGSRRVRRVPYGDVLSFDLRFKGRWRMLVIGTRRRVFFYPLRAFAERNTAEAFREHLKQRIEAAPDGRSQWASMVEREKRAEWAMARRPIATLGLLATIIGVFIAELVLGVDERPLGVVELGGNASVLVRAGQWHRLVSANFLHASVPHVVLNGVALLLLGTLVERIGGAPRFLLAFLLSALAGSVASTLAAQAAVSVGASAGIFGLLGALAVLNWRFRTELPAGFRQPTRWWVAILAINALLPVLVPQIDVAAHAGGLAVGGLVTFALYRHSGSLDLLQAPSRAVVGAVVAVCLVFAVGLGLAAQRALRHSEDDLLRVAETFSAGTSGAVVLNNVAWEFAVDAAASDRALQLARQLAEQAVDMEPENPSFLDTLATAHYRLGALDDAIAVERQALRHSAHSFHATQLARFLRARQAGGGPILLEGALESDVRIRVEPGPAVVGKNRAIVVEFSRGLQDGVVFFARVRHQGREIGLFWTDIGPEHERSYRMTDLDDPKLSYFPDEVEVQVALIDASGCAREDGTYRWWFRSVDRHVGSLP